MAYDPRSPHTAPSGFFRSLQTDVPPSPSFNHPPHNPTPPKRSYITFRPTRRDLLLCLVTLSFAYLLFTPPTTPPTPTDYPINTYRPPVSSDETRLYPDDINLVNPPSAGVGLDKLKEISHLFKPSTSHKQSCPSPIPIVREATFPETIRPVGLAIDGLDSPWGKDTGKSGGGGGDAWDGGEEEAEDDEFQSIYTKLFAHSPGWTLFEKLYLFNGSFYVVTDNRADWPELRLLTSTGLPANGDPGNEEAREPKGDEIIFVNPREATRLWGSNVYKMDGMTWLFQDGQFMDHYYHFAAELLLGAWRAYCAYDDQISAYGDTKLAPPSRIWFMHQDEHQWRDGPRFNPTILFGLFPNVATLYPSDFADLKKTTSSTSAPKAFMFPRALYADRSAAFRERFTGWTQRTAAGAYEVGTTSRWFWEPIRRQILHFSGVSDEIINRNLEGYGAVDPAELAKPIPSPELAGLKPLAPLGTYRPLVTYISRQKSRRRLTPESHDDLVQALEARAQKLNFEFIVVEAEKLTHEEQFALAARTTIMLGVHGNGLTHLLWMPATPRSAVIEMFTVGGFAHDYQWTAHALGIRHFAVQHDKTFTRPNEAKVDYPEGFQGSSITVVGSVVADLIEDRLAMKI